jgi:hypothetical protein
VGSVSLLIAPKLIFFGSAKNNEIVIFMKKDKEAVVLGF